MNDFESTIKQLLNDTVDATLGPRRPAPPLDVTASRRRGIRPWLVPLVAAAGVAAAIATIVVPGQLVADRPAGGSNGGLIAPQSHSAPPQSHSAPPQSNAAAPPTETFDPSAPPPSPLPPASTAVDLGGARLRLPVGWVAREVADPNQYGSSVYSREWCLAPASSAGPPRADCQLQFGPVAPVTTSGVPVNSSVPLGTPAGGKQLSCPAAVFWQQMGGGFIHLGQRPGIESDFTGSCPDGSTPSVMQYVVDTAPGYVLFANQQLTPELTAVMFEIARYASLPAQNAPLLLYDIGTVKAVTRQSDRYLMTIAPVVRVAGEWEPAGEARSYLIGPADLKYATVGTQVAVTTDGTKVISVGAPVNAR